MKDHVILAGIIAFIFSVLQSSFLPHTHFLAFAPFLVIVFLNYRLLPSLWIVAITGFLFDIFSDQFFGLFGLSFTLMTLIVYRLKRFCNYDKPLSIALFTSLVSLVYSLLQPLLLFLFDNGLSLSLRWLFTDLILMPLLDGLFALIVFILPLKIYDLSKRKVRRLSRRRS